VKGADGRVVGTSLFWNCIHFGFPLRSGQRRKAQETRGDSGQRDSKNAMTQ
jgi:hypothetical protein